LVGEAMRLTQLLISNDETNDPAARALMAIMCFHSSRFDARTSESGEMILYDHQDESRWNQELIARGVYWLNQSSTGDSYTTYHLEATIAYWHTNKTESNDKWENILQLYNSLLQLQYTPIAALNRTYALYRTTNASVALKEAHKLKLEGNRFYHALLAELYTGVDRALAIIQIEKAIDLTTSTSERNSLINKLNRINS
jgi:predicted RNA polymerase sigma factor